MAGAADGVRARPAVVDEVSKLRRVTMGTHPNTILMAVLTPDGLSRKTMRDILADNGVSDADSDVRIGEADYHHKIMEEDYEEGYQIAAGEGDLIFFNFVTYGYGEFVDWEDLEKQKNELKKWAGEMCSKHNCSFKIWVAANYW
jgi:hypothetical protein